MPTFWNRQLILSKEIQLLVLALIFGICSIGLTAESEPILSKEESAADELSVYGRIFEITDDHLVLWPGEPKHMTAFDEMGKDPHSFFEEEDLDHSQDIPKETYKISPTTKLENVTTVSELAPDDRVEIYYEDAEGQKIATLISRQGN